MQLFDWRGWKHMIQRWGTDWNADTFIIWFIWGMMVVAALAMVRETQKRIDKMKEQQELKERYGTFLSEDELYNLQTIDNTLRSFSRQQVHQEWQFHSLHVSKGDYISFRILTGESFRGIFVAVLEEALKQKKLNLWEPNAPDYRQESVQRRFCCLLPYEMDHAQATARVTKKPLFIPLESIVEDSVFASRES
jgi:hypothetical protein